MAQSFIGRAGCSALAGLLFLWIPTPAAGADAAPVVREHTPSTAAWLIAGNAFQWGSAWGGALEAIAGPWVQVGAPSAQPRGFISKLFDGNTGDLADPTGSYLIFDGSRVALTVVVPSWRRIEMVELFVLELARTKRARVRLEFRDAYGRSHSVPVVRQVMERRGRLARTVYVATGMQYSDGEFALTYDNEDLGSAFVGELSFDGMHSRPARKRLWSPELIRYATCRGNFLESLRRKTLHSNLSPSKHDRPRLVYWHKAPRAKQSSPELHALVVKVGRTGNRLADLARAWLVIPRNAVMPIPLVVVLGDPAKPHSGMELVGLTGEPQRAIARRLASMDMAVLVIDSPPEREAMTAFSMIARHLDGVLDVVTGRDFGRETGIAIDRRRLGLWGVERAALPAALAARQANYGFSAVALSRIVDHVPDPGMRMAIGVAMRCGPSDPVPAQPAVVEELAKEGIAVWLSGSDKQLLQDWESGLSQEARTLVTLHSAGNFFLASGEFQEVERFFATRFH